MLTLNRRTSLLLLVDLQGKLHPAIEGGPAVVREALRLANLARLFDIPVWATEHCPDRIGPLLPELAALSEATFHKTSFDACRTPAFRDALPAERTDIVVCGYEAHVCVMQTALGLLGLGRRVWAVRDAMGSRRAANREAALARLAGAGSTIITTEMAGFEWAEDAADPRWRSLLALVKDPG
ncbi:isochorismatase family protein [Sediminicoccus rosea]|jgi:nicotinamidase-related amidase|uniref:Isochorismatase family protein n=1 Tax=Sediminicoccus rosea TaxID=1225128 RepID=A0ABZ0PGH1_9PROT|nr:isochorismatase family protein [Sediminicoccus rosea]WPB84707.1 isochorismatase family protein [Sediminicoccus rosea]